MKNTAAEVVLWKYRENRRNYPGYHLTADLAGCEILRTTFQSLAHATTRLETSIALSPITPAVLSVPNNRAGNATVVCFEKWSLASGPEFEDPYFIFGESGTQCRLVLSRALCARVCEGIEDIGRGRGDYSVGAGGQQVLWFWWHPSRPLSVHRGG